MEKLRYLFENFNLAEMMVKNWMYDQESLSHFKNFRISSNAIYPFEINGIRHFLRLAPEVSKSRKYIEDEINYTEFLRNEGYSAVKFVQSLNGEYVETQETPWGIYHASVMEGVPGDDLETEDMTEEKARAFGAALGKLHKFSRAYKPADSSRLHCENALMQCKTFLEVSENDVEILQVIDQVMHDLNALSKENHNYGLIHYDFDLDNVFFDKATKSMSVIDFDDCMYSWYGMDVVLSLDKLGNADLNSHFLAGYREYFDVDLQYENAFRKFTLIYSYTRIAQSIQEVWKNEPDWMVNLRRRFKRYLETTKESILKN